MSIRKKTKKSKYKDPKVGDIIKPIEGRRASNYVGILKLKQGKVINSLSRYDYNYNTGRTDVFKGYTLQVKIIEGTAGSTQSWNGVKKKGAIISVYHDAFELATTTEDYQIY